MVSPSSSPFGYILNDHNRRDHSSRDSNHPNLRRPPTYSSKSHSQSPSKPRKNTHKDSINENNSSSSRVGNHHMSCSSYHNIQEVVPSQSPFMSRRQARVLDRWAAQQARETITTLDNKKHCKYDIPAISDSKYISFTSSTPSREPSPVPSDSSVSSLVQKWREFEATEFNNLTSPYQNQSENNFGGCSMLLSRTNSVASSSIEPFDQENHSVNTLDADQASITSNFRSIGDCNQGGREKDRVRVTDIIKKLPLVECKDVRTLSSTTVLCSPRIRGRQALADFLAKLENERYSEIEAISKRRVVSNFTKRGFLQSLLKLRLLRLEVSAQDQALQELHGVCVSNKQLAKKSTSSCNSMNSLRERFNPVIVECYDFVKTRHNQVDKLISNLLKKKASTSNQESQTIKVIDNKHQEETNLTQINNAISKFSHLEKDQVDNLDTKKSPLESKIHHQEQQERNMVNIDSIPSFDELVALDNTLREVTKEEHGQPKLLHSSNARWPEMINCDEVVNHVSLETNNMSSHEEHIGYEDEEKEDVYEGYDFYGINLDWINDVSRPRSYWESLRQAWYKEVYTTSSKSEIRQLIERGSVANVLASDFRDKMDKIMMSSSVKRKTQPMGYNDEDENHSSFDFHYTEMKPLSLHFNEEQEGNQNQQQHQSNNEEPISIIDKGREESKQEFAQENLKESEEEDCKYESLSFHQFNNRGNYYEQAQDPLSHFPKRNCNSHEDNDNSDQIEFTPQRQQSSITNFYDQETEGGSSIKNNSSIEMELINDLRAHMEQIYREMSELRKSLNHCVDMQEKLQRTIKDEVFVALNHSCSNKEKGKESNGKVAKNGFCSICYEKKVDSVLYRCGHMCACFKCSHELQWSSKKCPICLAQIVDVVRVFTHA